MKKNRKIITSSIDILIAITIIATVILALKYNYEVFFSNYQTEQSLLALEKQDENRISRDEFSPKEGEPIFKLKIEGLTGWIPVIEGDSLVNLEKGVTHNSNTGYPGDNRQIFTSGHRETHYKEIDQVKPEDIIIVNTPYGKYEYQVSNTKIVEETDVDVIQTGQKDSDELVLMTCYPFASWEESDQRFLVYAYPVDNNSITNEQA